MRPASLSSCWLNMKKMSVSLLSNKATSSFIITTRMSSTNCIAPALLLNIILRVMLLRILLTNSCWVAFTAFAGLWTFQIKHWNSEEDGSTNFFTSLSWYWGKDTSLSTSNLLPNSFPNIWSEQEHFFTSSSTLFLNSSSSAGQSLEGNTLNPAFCRTSAISSRCAFNSLLVQARKIEGLVRSITWTLMPAGKEVVKVEAAIGLSMVREWADTGFDSPRLFDFIPAMTSLMELATLLIWLRNKRRVCAPEKSSSFERNGRLTPASW